jgi:hypothetical protein
MFLTRLNRRMAINNYQQSLLTARNRCVVLALLGDGFRFEGYSMVQTWTSWKRFPDTRNGGQVEAPAGPGVYEVRHTLTGRVVSFGHSGRVAHALTGLTLNGAGIFARLFRRRPPLTRVSDLEYRTCAAGSRSEARTTASRLLGLRQTAWRRRLDLGWAARQAG